MKALVVGMGLSGLSMARALSAQGKTIVAVDSRDSPPQKEAFINLPAALVLCGEDFSRWRQFAEYETVAVSPGVDPNLLAVDNRDKIVGDAALFTKLWQKHSPPTKLFAVTGTNGKSSVVSLVSHLCVAGGVRAEAVGNIGEPLLDAFARWRTGGFPSAAVAELSSFQLQSCEQFFCDAATVLNIGDDHLDRHGSLQNYAAIKNRIYKGAKKSVINADDSQTAAMIPLMKKDDRCFSVNDSHLNSDSDSDSQNDSQKKSAAKKADWLLRDGYLIGGGYRFAVDDLSPPARSQPANVLAALALVEELNLPQESLRAALANYKGLAHRRQWVATVDGVFYVDDSKATNEDAAIFALSLSPQQTVLIAGGIGKGQKFLSLAQTAKDKVRLAILIGRDAAVLFSAFSAAAVPTVFAADMADAVGRAHGAARRGDTVLLSPACSSLDRFADYQRRGDSFAAAVSVLEKQNAS